ncbi:MAG: outer membrane beta-barrel protein [Hyphomicrobiales bacterium]
MRYALLSASAAAVLLGTVSARAADLPAPPPVATAPWSFSVFGGASWLEPVNGSLDFTDANETRYDIDSKLNFDTGFIVGGTFGYALVDWARTELEISYTGYDVSDAKFYPPEGIDVVDPNDASVGALSIFGNMWLGFNMLPVIGDPVNQLSSSLGGLSPYFGGGLGVAFVDANGDGTGYDLNASTTAFTWQVGAGVRWTFASNIGLDVGYRFRGINDVSFNDNGSANLYSNNVIVGLTFNF